MLLTACGGGGGTSGDVESAPLSQPAVALGQAQKGPFRAGSLVTLYRLDDAGNRLAEQLALRTAELGWFLPAAPWSGLTELHIEGVFFDETTGADSAQPLRLAGLARLPAGQTVRINLFTHLAAARTRVLMAAGADFDAARDLAWQDLQGLFDLPAADIAALTQLDLTDGTGAHAAGNANLLLFSAALLAGGIQQIDLDALADDFADDGLINAAALRQWIRVTVYAATVDLDQVRQRLETLDTVDRAPGFDALGHSYPTWVNLDGDADTDGVTDADEVLQHGSDPLRADSDADGMPDGWEIANLLDPLSDDAGNDADGDGLSNALEFAWLTDPHNADSDGDSWSDGFEIAAGGDPGDAARLPLVFLSSPLTSVETGFTYVYAAGVTQSGASFALDEAPAGFAVDADSGVASWKPSLAQLGDFAVTLRATAGGYSVTQSFVITTTPGNTGDINQDDVVDAKDILLAQRIALGLMTPDPVQQVRGDLSADGAVAATDVIRLERLVMGL